MSDKKRKRKKKKVQEMPILHSALYDHARKGMTRKILALDLAKNTGWAMYDDRDGLCSGVWKFRGSPGARWTTLYSRIIDKDPDVIVYEESGNWRGNSAVRCYHGWLTAVEMAAELLGAYVVGLHANSLKKWSTGDGRATKAEMIRTANEQWPGVDIIDNNHADALCLLTWAIWRGDDVPGLRLDRLNYINGNHR